MSQSESSQGGRAPSGAATRPSKVPVAPDFPNIPDETGNRSENGKNPIQSWKEFRAICSLLNMDSQRSYSNRVEFLRIEYIAGVLKTRVDVVDSDARVVPQDVVVSPALCEEIR